MTTFDKILDTSLGLGRELPDIVFIGGVAVYLHTLKRASSAIPLEASHDADFTISFSGYDFLKDAAEITATPRLAKHQMVVDDVEFDVYVERLNRLVVPYDEIFAHKDVVEGIGVACLEHLLVLKLEAFAKREHSTKGDKDRRDVVKIGLLLGRKARRSLIRPYMRAELASRLEDIARSAIFTELCGRNAHVAKKMRASFAAFVADVS
jgi:hypothetical protein